MRDRHERDDCKITTCAERMEPPRAGCGESSGHTFVNPTLFDRVANLLDVLFHVVPVEIRSFGVGRSASGCE